MSEEKLSLSKIDRMMLSLYKERLSFIAATDHTQKQHILSQHEPDVEAEKPLSAEELLSEEEMKSTAFLAASTAFLRSLNALCTTHSVENHYYAYPDHIRRAMADTPNEFPRIASFGFCEKDEMNALKIIFPAGRTVFIANTILLMQALYEKKIDFAIVPIESDQGKNNYIHTLLRRYHFFVRAVGLAKL